MNKQSRRFLLYLFNFFKDFKVNMISWSGAVGLALGGCLIGSGANENFELWGNIVIKRTAGWSIFLLSSIALLWSQISTFSRTERLTELNKQIERLGKKLRTTENNIQEDRASFFDLFNNYLFTLMSHIPIIDDKNAIRISVYKHEHKALVMLGRYSINPQFCAPGRSYYPDNQGCIGKAWRNGESYINNLPNPKSNFEEYLTVHENDWNFQKQEVEKLGMKSRSLAGFAITNSEGTKRIGVIIIESVKENAFDIEAVRTFIKKQCRMLSFFVEKMPSKGYELNYSENEEL